MAYLRTLQPEEMISGDLGKKAVGCLPISTSQFPANRAPPIGTRTSAIRLCRCETSQPFDDSSDLRVTHQH